MKLTATLLFLIPTSVFAAVGGHCTGGNLSTDERDSCVCTTRSGCEDYGGDWSRTGLCPDDGAWVRGCFTSPCKNTLAGTVCRWKTTCSKYGSLVGGEHIGEPEREKY